MKAQVRILTGARSGHTEVFSKSYVGIGRHPASDLRFDPERDLDVSARHAALLRQGAQWHVRDLGSRNGTFVNGHPIQSDTKLDDTDQIRFGPEGPAFEFRLVPDGTPDGVQQRATRASAPQAAPAAPRATSGHASVEGRGEGSTTERVRVEVARYTRLHRGVTIGLVAVLLLGAGAFVLYNRQQSAVRERAIAAMQARTDRTLQTAERAIAQLQGRVEGLAQALERSHSQVERLQSQLTSARRTGDRAEVAALERQLTDATQALSYQRAAAEVDYRGIVDANQRAVAMVIVRFPNGDVSSGTAFAVSRDGVLLTNRHVVTGERGDRTPVELGVQFADSDQFFPARLLGVSDDADLALIKTDVRGGVPAAQALNARPDTLRQGDPVAIIGFPLGTSLAMDFSNRNRMIARTTFTAGTVSKVLADNIQIDGYSTVGGSGSPIFDGNGEVVAILYGAPKETGGRMIYSVPASFAVSLLRRLGGQTDRR